MPEPLPHVVREPICIWPQLSPSGAALRFHAAHLPPSGNRQRETPCKLQRSQQCAPPHCRRSNVGNCEQSISLVLVHPPFHNRARKIPSDVSQTGKEMVIAVTAGISLEHVAIHCKQPF